MPDICVTKTFASVPTRAFELVPEGPDAEDGTVLPVVFCKEFANVARHLESIAGDRPSRHFRYFLVGPNDLRGRSGRLNRPNALPDHAAHQIEPGDGVNTLLHIGVLISRKDALEHAGSRREANDNDIARVRDILAEKRRHHTGPDILLGLPVDGRIATGPCDRSGRKHKAVVLGFQNAASDQPVERLCADGAAAPRREHDPVGGVVRFGFADNVLKGGIEQVVVHWIPSDQEEPLRIRVDTALERQIHQHGAGNHCIPLMRREGMLNAATLGIHNQ